MDRQLRRAPDAEWLFVYRFGLRSHVKAALTEGQQLAFEVRRKPLDCKDWAASTAAVRTAASATCACGPTQYAAAPPAEWSVRISASGALVPPPEMADYLGEARVGPACPAQGPPRSRGEAATAAKAAVGAAGCRRRSALCECR